MAYGTGDTFRSYKRDTNVVVHWLSSTSIFRGYKFPHRYQGIEAAILAHSKKSKTRAYPSSQIAIPLPTNIVLAQAKYLADLRKPEQVPVKVQVSLQRAIETRQQCSEWYSNNRNSVKDKDSTAKHEFFTTCLLRIQKTLRPHFMEEIKRSTTVDSTTPLENDIDKLDINLQTEEKEDAEPDTEQTPERKKSWDDDTMYELDSSTDNNNILLKVFAFFEDLHCLEEFIKTMWELQNNGKLTLETAAMVTNVALNLVEKSEAELVRSTPEIFKDASQAHDELLHYLRNADVGPYQWDGFNEAVYLLEALALTNNRYMLEDAPLSYKSWSTALASFDPSRPFPKLAQREDFISKMMLDLDYATLIDGGEEYLGRCKTPEHGSTFPDRISSYLDAPTKYLLEILNIKRTGRTFRAVFSARVLNLINETLGEKGKDCYLKLRQAGAEARNLMDIDIDEFQKEYHHHREAARLRQRTRKNRHKGTKIKTTSTTLDEWVQRDAAVEGANARMYLACGIEVNYFASMKASVIDMPIHHWDVPCESHNMSFQENHPGRIWPSKYYTFYHDHNPIYSGIECLKLQLVMNMASRAFCHGGILIIVTCHLYNMIKQLNHSFETPWVGLEAFMEDYKSELFCGSYPQTPDDIVKRFLICGGVKASSFAPNVRAATFQKMLQTKVSIYPAIFQPPALSVHLEKYLDGHTTADDLLREANQLRNSKNQTQNSRDPSNVEFLSTLRDELEDLASSPQMRHDYITLHRQCSLLYKDLRDYLKTSSDAALFIKDGMCNIDLGIRLVEAASGGSPHPSVRMMQKPVPGLRKLHKGLFTVFEKFIPTTIDEESVAPLSIESVIQRAEIEV